LLHEDGQQEGVAVGYTKGGLKPCLHPLLAVTSAFTACSRLNPPLLLHPTKYENSQKKAQFEHSDGLFFPISRTKREETENE
jgi:hypothetical protein